MEDATLSKDEILRSFGAVRRLFQDGKGGFVYPFRFMTYAEPSDRTAVRVIFSTPKRYHKRAVKRNRVRRCMKDIYRRNKGIIYDSGLLGEIDLALIYSSKEIVDYVTMQKSIRRILTMVRDALS